MTPMLQLEGLTQSYEDGRGKKRTVLRGVTYGFEQGKLYAIVGTSGAGKTTMLSLASGLDSPTAGTVSFRGQDIAAIGLNRYRNRHAATIFQSFNLLSYLNAIQNVTTAMSITKVPGPHRARATELLEELGIKAEDQRRNVLQLSGGQQQRVAIARAVACEVDVLFADEPTGSLDEETAADIIAVFRKLAHEQGKLVVVVTHSVQVARAADHVVQISKGKLTVR